MEGMKIRQVGIPIAECEKILTEAKKRGADQILYKAVTMDREPLSVTDIRGVLTAMNSVLS